MGRRGRWPALVAASAIAGLAACSGSASTAAASKPAHRGGTHVRNTRTYISECHPGGDWSKVPRGIPVRTGQGPTPQGFMRREDFCGTYDHANPIPVYDRALTTLVGHMYTGRGFVSVRTDPATVPCARGGFSISRMADGSVVSSSVPPDCDPPYLAP